VLRIPRKGRISDQLVPPPSAVRESARRSTVEEKKDGVHMLRLPTYTHTEDGMVKRANGS